MPPPTNLEILRDLVKSREAQHFPDEQGRLHRIDPRSAKDVLAMYEQLNALQRERFVKFTIPQMVDFTYEIRVNQKRRLDAERRARLPTHCERCGKLYGTCECDW